MTNTIVIPLAPKGTRVGEKRGRRLVARRSAGVCEVCSERRGTRWHARKAFDDGGTWEPANGLQACAKCKKRLDNPECDRAKHFRLGWLVDADHDPADVPVQINHGHFFGLYLLDNDGDYIAAYPETVLDCRIWDEYPKAVPT